MGLKRNHLNNVAHTTMDISLKLFLQSFYRITTINTVVPHVMKMQYQGMGMDEISTFRSLVKFLETNFEDKLELSGELRQ